MHTKAWFPYGRKHVVTVVEIDSFSIYTTFTTQLRHIHDHMETRLKPSLIAARSIPLVKKPARSIPLVIWKPVCQMNCCSVLVFSIPSLLRKHWVQLPLLILQPQLYHWMRRMRTLTRKMTPILIIVNREEGLEAGGVSDNMLKFWSRDNTSALESRLVIRAVQKIKLCLAKRLVFLPRSRKS